MIMLATSPSPSLHPQSNFDRRSLFPAVQQHEHIRKLPSTRFPPKTVEIPRQQFPSPRIGVPRPLRRSNTRSLDSLNLVKPRPKRMVDASTQYSPPGESLATKAIDKTPTSRIAGLQLGEKSGSLIGTDEHRMIDQQQPSEIPPEPSLTDTRHTTATKIKRHAAASPERSQDGSKSTVLDHEAENSPSKRARPDAPDLKMMPVKYEDCDTRDLVILISSMLMELIRYNDEIPLRDGHLTRFHSRAPPGISVLDYLQRLTTHATLPPPILLSMVYYIDKLCAFYPAFTISSLTVHRFLITSATVASKGLSDSFWNNKTYAKVGGVSLKELALLELEFLTRVEWRIVPRPEVLNDYYKSLIERSPEHSISPA